MKESYYLLRRNLGNFEAVLVARSSEKDPSSLSLECLTDNARISSTENNDEYTSFHIYLMSKDFNYKDLVGLGIDRSRNPKIFFKIPESMVVEVHSISKYQANEIIDN